MRLLGRSGLVLLTLLAGGLLLASCSDDPDGEKGEGEGEGEGSGEIEFPAGLFDVETREVDDGCVDGALNVLFMPEGPTVPKQFQYPIEIPAPADLPKTYTIQLQDPFKELEITMEKAGVNKLRVVDALNADVLLDETTYGDCRADLVINFNVDILDRDHISADVSIGMSNLRGDRCPQLSSPDCTITLALHGTRE